MKKIIDNSKYLLRALSILGGQKNAAKLLNRTQPTISKWIKEGVPAIHVVKIQYLTNNKVYAYQILPNVFPKGYVCPKCKEYACLINKS